MYPLFFYRNSHRAEKSWIFRLTLTERHGVYFVYMESA